MNPSGPLGDPASYSRNTRSWERLALILATLALLAPLSYFVRFDRSEPVTETQPQPQFIGSEKCAACHREAYEQWRGSHHDLAMALASEDTVLGDFDEASYTDPYNRVTSRFFKKDGGFWVETEGPDGALGTFRISHTFGVFPLQQYLIPFPGGKLQALNLAWDVGEQHWYRLPPYDVEGPGDWLHWTNSAQTWNAMCAECHSTRLSKGFNPEDATYQTTWFEIDVGCEACHGPGSNHAAWAARSPMARPESPGYELLLDPRATDNRTQITVCAPCHARRYQLGDNLHRGGQLLDTIVPSLLQEGLYFPDGQILEEVYVYGSFSQSKMYQHEVRCSDCHNVHSLKPHREGNALCLQCHRAAAYDTPDHHFHKKEHNGAPSNGHLCVSCHMPGRLYMGIDFRPDHSLRLPRPDLTEQIGVPNSCSTAGCHPGKDLEWVLTNYRKWYGTTRKMHYGEVFAAAREHRPEAGEALIDLAGDQLLPAIVRATALSLLTEYPGPETTDIFTRLLESPEALLRHTAIRHLNQLKPETRVRLISPKLYDKVKAVRIEAAAALAGIPEDTLRNDDLQAFRSGLEEYREAMLYNSDFAPQRYNLANLEAALGNLDQAVELYTQAIAIDSQFYPARVNLATILNRQGKNDQAAELLRTVIEQRPEMHQVAYSLGLLLAEMEQYREAIRFLRQAADGMPGYARARYNLALGLLKLQKWRESEAALLRTLEIDPENREYFSTLANLYLQFGMTGKAEQLARRTLQAIPGHQHARQLLESLR